VKEVESFSPNDRPSVQASAVHCIHKLIPGYWQEFFEKNLGILDDTNDCYQFHAFVLKQNRFYQWQRRFIVFSIKWLFNVTADFETSKDKAVQNPVLWKKCNWKVPPQAVEKVVIEEKSSCVAMKIHFNLQKMNDILSQNGQKKIKKEKRTFLFGNLPSARDFLFHLRRLHHLHNTVIGKNPSAPVLVIEDNY
jgi:hypothetical protein